jgi:hypothetical protein
MHLFLFQTRTLQSRSLSCSTPLLMTAVMVVRGEGGRKREGEMRGGGED